MLACLAGHIEIIQLLSRQGAAVDTTDMMGRICINYAMESTFAVARRKEYSELGLMKETPNAADSRAIIFGSLGKLSAFSQTTDAITQTVATQVSLQSPNEVPKVILLKSHDQMGIFDCRQMYKTGKMLRSKSIGLVQAERYHPSESIYQIAISGFVSEIPNEDIINNPLWLKVAFKVAQKIGHRFPGCGIFDNPGPCRRLGRKYPTGSFYASHIEIKVYFFVKI